MTKICDFKKEIIKIAGIKCDLSLRYNKKMLTDEDTILSRGIENNGHIVTRASSGNIMKVTIIYRCNKYEIEIDLDEQVLELKKLVAQRTEIKVENICLKVVKIVMLDENPISKYLEDGFEFTMAYVTIIVYVKLFFLPKAPIWSFFVNEMTKICEFKKEIFKKAGFSCDFSLCKGGIELRDEDSILSNDIENGDFLDGMPNKSEIRTIEHKILKVTISYRYDKYEIEIDQVEQISELKKRVAELTKINVKNFSLKVYEQLYMNDNYLISAYLEDGSEVTMANVTIQVMVSVKGQGFAFFVNEMAKICDFKKDIVKKTGVKYGLNLCYNGTPLADEDTILSRDIQNNAHIIHVALV